MHIDGLPKIDYSEVFRRLEEKKHEDINLAQYFPPEEWKKMCDYEKLRYTNMLVNYELMVEFSE